MLRLPSWMFLLVILGSGCGNDFPEAVEAAYVELPKHIDFNLHVRPIISDRCYPCHGPDKKTQKADFALHTEELAFAALKSGAGYAFVSGKPHKSLALERMISEDSELLMPPPESNLTLTPKEIATVAKWIDQGAEWKDHWAFIVPESPTIPKVEGAANTKNPIDLFIHKKLEEENLQPSKEATKEQLLRRVTRDLTGLPPTVKALDEFLKDNSPNAYEKVVDRLLASDAYGERMAMEWMDLARYADSHGMHADGWRMMWPWRDWVINAFNENMPYDQFVSWQLAGDLMPDATKDQILATAFNRNHTMTAEGGAIDEEFRLEYVFDRTNTAATAFMGLTMECARCHDHKFDPISQEEYFQMTAFFNNVKEVGMTGDDGNYGPMMLLTDEATDKKLLEIQEKIAVKEKALEQTKEEVAAAAKFINSLKISKPAASFNFESLKPGKTKEAKGWLTEGYFVDGSKNGFVIGKDIELVDGRNGKVIPFEEEYNNFFILNEGVFEWNEAYSAALWMNTTKRDSTKTQVLMGTAGNKNNFWRGWDFYLDGENRLSVRLIHSLPHNYIHTMAEDVEIPLNTWTHVGFSYDGSGLAKGIKIYINGIEQNVKTQYNKLYKSILPVTAGSHELTNKPIMVGKSGRDFTGENGIFKGMMDEVAVFKKELTEYEFANIVGIDSNKKMEADYQVRQSSAYQNIQKELSLLRAAKLSLIDTVPEVMVMEEMEKPRPAYVLNRGQYNAPTYKVEAGTPSKVLSFSEDLPKNRLGLSKWLFSKTNPLTARVAVNRYWQLFFGNGLVKTPQDFGSQGSLPVHPELLDWLAVEFKGSNWDLKGLCKKIVLSQTYRQSSTTSKKALDRDPSNDLLARGSSYRLTGEMIRDNALATSGLLVNKIGGESVKPVQPDGLWYELGNFSHKLLHYKADEGDKQYRRSLYTFVRRTSPPPNMTTFDAPSRDICIVKREITNTPLQALVLLNDPQFVEASKAFAVRIQKEGGDQLNDQLQFAFRAATSRQASKEELEILNKLFEKEKSRFSKDPNAIKEILSVGQFKVDPKLDKIITAAMTSIASTLLNHDEAYMKR